MLFVCQVVFAKGVGSTEISQLSAPRTLTFVEAAEARLSMWSDTTRRSIAWLGAVTSMNTTILCTMESYTLRVSDLVSTRIVSTRNT
jgi:hypothetical protein